MIEKSDKGANKMFKRVICIALFCSCVILGGCAKDLDEEQAEQQVTSLVKTYYSALCSKDYEQARDTLYFPPGFDDSLKERYSDYSGSPLLESYSIYETKKLTDKLYSVNVVGIMLSPVEYCYDDDGEIVGIKEPRDGRQWYVESLDVTNYAAYVDGKWRFCVWSNCVPEGMYDFPEMQDKILTTIE